MAHKGGADLYKCPLRDDGTNVLSVMYIPAESRAYVGFEYSSGSSYKTACCGVYVDIDFKEWFF